MATKTFIFLITFTALIKSAMPQGTAPIDNDNDGYLEISSKANLLYLSENPNADWTANYEQTTNITFTDADFQSGGDFYNGGAGFTPIGHNSDFFSGIYEGNEYIIDGLFIRRYGAIDGNTGLFGYVTGTLKNLGVTNVDIIGRTSVGGLVGNLNYSGTNYGTIVNCFSSGSVNGLGYDIGGLVGLNLGSNLIADSYSTADVNGGSDLGGLVGVHSGATIRNCYSRGNVEGSNNVGGLVGITGSNAIIKKSYSTGNVSGITGVGGLLGNSYNSNITVTNSFWDKETSGQTTSYRGNGKTTAEMKRLCTFADATWDFPTTWTMNESDNNGYPALAWQGYSQTVKCPPLLGSGTAGDPYQIESVANLITLSNRSDIWDKYFIQTANIAFNEDVTQIDWDNDGNPDGDGTSGFSPIGNSTTKFTGEYNGDGHTIENLYINRSGTDNIGLFGYIDDGALVKKLGVINVNFTGYNNVGSLIGKNSKSDVSKSFGTGTVNGTYNTGGLVGHNLGIGYNEASLSYSYSKCIVNGSSSVGGLVGYNYNTDVSNCYSIGSVNGVSSVGGLMGDNSNSPFSNSFWDYETSGEVTSSGGIGKTTAEMKDFCTFSDANWDFPSIWTMNASDNNGYPALAWQGYNHAAICIPIPGSGTENDPHQITSVDILVKLSNRPDLWDKYFIQTANISFNENEAQVDWNGDGNPDGSNTSGFFPIGNSSTAFTGEYNGDGHFIENLYISRLATDDIGLFGSTDGAYISNISVVNVDINGQNTIGALIGKNANTTIINSYSSGSINGNENVGGLVGVNDNNASMTNSYSLSSSSGNAYIGGLAGRNIASTIEKCYSRGLVSGNSNVGGLVAENNSTVSNSFWDTQVSSISSSDGGTGKSTSEMKRRSTFTGWNFESIWGISSNVNSGYPNLDNVNSGTTYTWNGSQNSNWNNTDNWDSGSVPISSDDVVIANVGYDPVITSTQGVECNALTVNTGSTLTVKSGGSLITHGSITNNGSINIERSIPNDQWHLVSSPVEGATANVFVGQYMQSWDESTESWTDIKDAETTLTSAKGYSIWGMAKGDYTFSGTPFTGSQSTALSHDGAGSASGFNLVGNPYPSSINWDLLQPTYGTAYIWDASAASGAGDYVEWNASSGGTQNIPPMQGFFVYTGSNATLNLANSHRTHNGAENYYKSANTGDEITNGLVLEASNGNYADEFTVRFDEKAAAGFELTRDSWKLLSNGQGVSQIWSESPEGRLAVDVRPHTPVLQLGFYNDTKGSYSIGAPTIKGLSEATLEDTKTSIFHNLMEDAYTFEWDINDAQTRFKLHLKTVGIGNEISKGSQGLLIYAHGQNIYLRAEEASEAKQLTVRDITGRIVLQKRIRQSGTITIPTSLQTGIYIVEVIHSQKRITQKIYINQ